MIVEDTTCFHHVILRNRIGTDQSIIWPLFLGMSTHLSFQAVHIYFEYFYTSKSSHNRLCLVCIEAWLISLGSKVAYFPSLSLVHVQSAVTWGNAGPRSSQHQVFWLAMCLTHRRPALGTSVAVIQQYNPYKYQVLPSTGVYNDIVITLGKPQDLHELCAQTGFLGF